MSHYIDNLVIQTPERFQERIQHTLLPFKNSRKMGNQLLIKGNRLVRF